MSMKLVRKFLQEDDTIDASEAQKQQAKKRRKRRRESQKEVATEDDLLQATVQSMVYLDKAMTTYVGKSDSKNGAMKRINDEARKAKKRRKKLQAETVVGNSRSSSSQLRLPSMPTFNKKRYKKEQEENRLKEIAKLLKKQAKKKK